MTSPTETPSESQSQSPLLDNHSDRTGDGGDGDDNDCLFRQSVLSSINEADNRSTAAAANTATRYTRRSSSSNNLNNAYGDSQSLSGHLSSTINDNTLGASRFGMDIGSSQSQQSQAQSTWMFGKKDNHNDTSHQSRFTSTQSDQRSKSHSTTSLFGAVMQRFGHSQTDQPDKRDNETAEQNDDHPDSLAQSVVRHNKNDDNDHEDHEDEDTSDMTDNLDSSSSSDKPSTSRTGMLGRLGQFSSPAGKSLMSLLTSTHSPFKFRSPTGKISRKNQTQQQPNRKGGRRGVKRQLDLMESSAPAAGKTNDLNDDDDRNKKRQRHIDQETTAFAEGEVEDEAWVEIPVQKAPDSYNRNNNNTYTLSTSQIPFVDWSINTRVRLEWYDHDKNLASKSRNNHERSIISLSIRKLLSGEEWKAATSYYEFQSTAKIPGSTQPKAKPQLRRQSSLGAMRVGPEPMIQQGYQQHGLRLDTSGKPVPSSRSISSFDFAKMLVRKVQGSKVQFSRQLCMDSRTILQPGIEQQQQKEQQEQQQKFNMQMDSSYVVERQQQQQWRQALCSLYSNYRRSLEKFERSSFTLSENKEKRDGYDDRDSLVNRAILDSYFYSVGEGHTVVFRTMEGRDADWRSEDDDKGTIPTNDLNRIVPVVLISDCSRLFLDRLQSNGRHLFRSSDTDGDTHVSGFDIIQDVQNDPPVNAIDSFPASPSPTVKRKHAISPATKADLEALRRARVFGESAGADVFIKIKKDGKDRSTTKQTDSISEMKSVRFVGWDQVDLFFEAYLNLYGAVTGPSNDESVDGCIQPLLPSLFCPDQLGPFANCQRRNLSIFPVPDTSETTSNTSGPVAAYSIDVCGMILPTSIYQMLLIAGTSTRQDRSIYQPTFDRYIILQTYRHKSLPVSLRGLNRSFIFNQKTDENVVKAGNDRKNALFQCPTGKITQLAVWDKREVDDPNSSLVAFRLEQVAPCYSKRSDRLKSSLK